MDTAQWPQEIVVKPIEEIVTNTCPKPSSAATAAIDHQRKATRPQKEQALNCPRCNSTNTKFCYYNNYSLTQPRYFCKTCRRYWTEGGSLRNIPVGGGSRKNKRSSSASLSSSTSNIPSSLSSSSKKQLPDLVSQSSLTHQNPNKIIHEGQDLNSAFQGFRSNISEFVHVPNNENNNKNKQISSSNCSTTSPATTSAQISALELLTGMSSRGLNSFMPMPIQDPSTVYNTSGSGGFNSMQEFKPTLHFSFDGLGSSSGGYGGGLDQETNGSRLLFPFEDLKPVSHTTTTDDQNREQGAGYWTGMLGGGSW